MLLLLVSDVVDVDGLEVGLDDDELKEVVDDDVKELELLAGDVVEVEGLADELDDDEVEELSDDDVEELELLVGWFTG